jgi:hypothetical protein
VRLEGDTVVAEAASAAAAAAAVDSVVVHSYSVEVVVFAVAHAAAAVQSDEAPEAAEGHASPAVTQYCGYSLVLQELAGMPDCVLAQ